VGDIDVVCIYRVNPFRSHASVASSPFAFPSQWMLFNCIAFPLLLPTTSSRP
jgi:hypothetical protein